MEQFTIGQLARRFGLRTSALRFYERIGLLPPPLRHSGQRRYDTEAATRLATIQAAQQAGFTLGEVHTLLDGFASNVPPPERWRTLAMHKAQELDALIARAEAMKQHLQAGAACACTSFAICPLLAEATAAEHT